MKKKRRYEGKKREYKHKKEIKRFDAILKEVFSEPIGR
jgi:hypothetical protein